MDLKGNEIARHDSIQRAAETINSKAKIDSINSFIHKAIHGVRPTAYGSTWKYSPQADFENEIWKIDIGGLNLRASTAGRIQELGDGVKAKKFGSYGNVHKDRHPEVQVDGNREFVHVIIARNFIGPCPVGMTVDHIINGLPIEKRNRVENLRYATPSEQSYNRRSFKQRSHKLTNSNNLPRIENSTVLGSKRKFDEFADY